MKVNRNNYEVWMIDYFDGKLNAGQVAELLAFIKLHEDIKEEFEQFDGFRLEAENIRFDQKNKLHQTPVLQVGEIGEENFEEYFIAFYENDLDSLQKEDLIEFIKINPQFENDFKVHGKLMLLADLHIDYNDKESLKKKPSTGIFWWSGSVAAAILILFGVFRLFQLDNAPVKRELITLNKMPQKVSYLSVSINSSTKLLEREDLDIVVPIIEEDYFIAEPMAVVTLSSKSIVPVLVNIRDYSYYDYRSGQTDIYYASSASPEKKNKKPGLFAKIVKNYSKRAKVKRNAKEDKKKKNEPGIVKFLDQSITVFNTITGSDTEMVKTYNEEGNLTFYQVEGETISWSKNISANPNTE